MPMIAHQCQNCTQIFSEAQLHPIDDVLERVNPGEVMPHGQCPECNALTNAVEVDVLPNFKVSSYDADVGMLEIAGETRQLGFLDVLYEDKINASLELTRQIARLLTPEEAFVAHFQREPGFVDDGLPQYGAHCEEISPEDEVERFVAETLDVHEEYRALVALILKAREAI